MGIAIECVENGADKSTREKEMVGRLLIIAAFNGSTEVLRLLLDNGADVDLTNYKGTTPLMYAMSHYEKTGRRDVFDLLIENGASLDLAAFSAEIY